MAGAVFTTDPTGEMHDGMPTFIWRDAPEGLATRRQLSAKGLRPGGQPPVAQIRRGRLFANLYDQERAVPKRPMTAAMRTAVRIAARSRQRCVECLRTDLGYIPRQAAPCWGRCWDCMGLSPNTDLAEIN